MKSAALGIRMHSGWGVLVAVNEHAEVVDRRRIVVISQDGPRRNQPYHHAQGLALPNAEKFLAEYLSEAGRLAKQEIHRATTDLNGSGFKPVVVAVLLASGRKLPPLPQILAAHPLIHTAEGELFRDAVGSACKLLSIPVLGMREREIESRAKEVFAASAAKLISQLAKAGKSLGPPWNADHKSAALAACIALHINSEKAIAGGA